MTVKFNGPTEGTPIGAGNIETALALSNGHTWLDGLGDIGLSSGWNITKDQLTIYLKTLGALPTVAVGDIITLDGTIKDVMGAPIIGSVTITGDFGIDVIL